MIKRLFFLVLFLCSIVSAMFWKQGMTFLGEYFVQKAFQEQLGIAFEKTQVTYVSGSFLFDEVRLKKVEGGAQYLCSMKQMRVSPFWKDGTFQCDLFFSSPDLLVVKEEDSFDECLQCFFPKAIHIGLDQGTFTLKDQQTNKTVSGEIFSCENDPHTYRILTQESSLLCNFTDLHEGVSASVDLQKIALSEAATLSTFFCGQDTKHTEISGNASGLLQLTWENSRGFSCFMEMKAKELSIERKAHRLETEDAFFTCQFPVEEECFCPLATLFFPGLEKTALSAEVQGASLYVGELCHLDQIQGKLSFIPSIGPKMYLFSTDPEGRMVAWNLRGYFHSKKANWLDASVQVDGDEIVCKAVEKSSGGIALRFLCSEVSNDKFTSLQETARSFYEASLHPLCLEGTTSVDVSLDYERGSCTNLEVHQILLENLAVTIPEKEVRLFSALCHLEGSYDLSDSTYDSLCAKGTIEEGSIGFSGYLVENGSTTWTIDQGYIVPSKGFFTLAGITNHVEISGAVDECSLTSLVKGKTGAFFEQYGDFPETFDLPLSASISLKRKNEEALIFGSMQLGDEEISFGLDLGLTLQEWCSVHHGWMRAKEIDLHHYQIFFPNISLYGNADVSMQYQKKRAYFALSGSGYSFATKGVTLSLDRTSNISCSYNFAHQGWDLDLLMQGASLSIAQYGFVLENIEGPLVIRNNVLKALNIDAKCEELSMGGDVHFDFSHELRLDLHCKELSGPIDSLLSSLETATRSAKEEIAFPTFSHGVVSAYDEGCFLSTNFSDEFLFGADLCLEQGELTLHDQAKLKDMRCKISYRSNDHLPSYLTFSSVLDLHGQQYLCKVPYVSKKAGGTFLFDVRLEEGYWDLMRTCGSFQMTPSGECVVTFTPGKTELFGEKLAISDCRFHPKIGAEGLTVAGSFPLASLVEKMPFALSCLCLDHYSLPTLDTSLLDGTVEAALSFSGETTSIEIEGKDLAIEGQTIDHLFINAHTIAEGWRFNRCAVDDFSAAFSWHHTKNIPHFFLYWQNEKVAELAISHKGKGAFLMEVKQVEMEINRLKRFFPQLQPIMGEISASGYIDAALPSKTRSWQFDLDLDIEPQTVHYQDRWSYSNHSPVHLSYSLEEGLLVTGLNFSALSPHFARDDLRFQVGSLAYEKGDYFFKEVSFYVPQDLALGLLTPLQLPSTCVEWMEEITESGNDIRISADLRVKETGDGLFCTMAELSIPLGEEACRFEELTFSLTNEAFYSECYVPLADSYYRLQAEIERGHPARGRLVFEERELNDLPLIVTWEMGEAGLVQCQSIQGVFSGIDASFHQSDQEQVLSGSLKVDFSKASALFPQTVAEAIKTYDLASGYEFRGKLRLDLENLDYAFDGLCSGKQFEAMGYTFKTLLSKLHVSSGSMVFEDLKISDSSGIVKIPKIVCKQEDENWELAIPKIALEEFRPSLLQEVGKPLGPIQPLVVRAMQIDDLRLNLSDPRECTAVGELTFINSFKRGHSVLDIPADILGRIFGLDLELLIPVKGDLSFSIRDGRVILTDLRNSFSEGGRSQFFLAEKQGEFPFMDLDGELSVYIKMKQFVLFKFTENFVISITGKLHDPKFGLERKSSFFSS
ncbi:MAG: hypothetical protein AAGI90_04595 [Chlamydiota bacterium]